MCAGLRLRCGRLPFQAASVSPPLTPLHPPADTREETLWDCHIRVQRAIPLRNHPFPSSPPVGSVVLWEGGDCSGGGRRGGGRAAPVSRAPLPPNARRDYTTTTTHTTVHKQTTRMSLHSHASHSDWPCGYGTIRYATPTCTEKQNDFYLLQSLSDSLKTRRADSSHLLLHTSHTLSFLRHHHDELFKKETNKSDVHEHPFPPSLCLLFHLLPSFQTLKVGSPLRFLSP